MNQNDLDIMARTLYGESAPNDQTDAKLIASVIMTRVKKKNWPDTPSGVCLQPWQFSCWNPGDPNRKRIQTAAGPWFEQCKAIARAAYGGDNEYLPMELTHYYANYVRKPKWAKGKKPSITNGVHIYFNGIDTPPPQTSQEALNQQRPISSSRTVQGGAVVASTGVLATTVGVIGQVSPAVPVVKEVAETAQNHPTGLLLAFGLAVLAAAGYILYARLSDRYKGAH